MTYAYRPVIALEHSMTPWATPVDMSLAILVAVPILQRAIPSMEPAAVIYRQVARDIILTIGPIIIPIRPIIMGALPLLGHSCSSVLLFAVVA